MTTPTPRRDLGVSPRRLVHVRRRLLAEHHALRTAVEPRAAAREAATKDAIASQRAAHDAESRAWARLSSVRDARRAHPHDLGLVAAADQAEAAHQEAREAADIAQRALEESARDNRLKELGARCRAAQDRYLAAAARPPANAGKTAGHGHSLLDRGLTADADIP